ncbi:unnamed protein product [Caenorhabditis auriculariae]|uniref:Reticulocalbin-3 n=1 Tax=Caenorhabditis auriculariae TaxID=2777116 RepID=A0A8S1H9Z2_9PELO|nr:unnamed protein product [Caenorhabditis auriculariae]
MKFLILAIFISFVLADKERETDGAAARMNRHVHEAKGNHHADHQAVLGSKKTAEEFDSLPVEEAQRRLRILAKKMDNDKDGFIEQEELVSWVKSSMTSLDEEETKERMREIDVDGDGFITWNEYLEDSFPDSDISKLDAEDRKLLNEDELYFKAADLDRDDRLNVLELAAFLNPENYPHMHSTLVDVTLLEKDRNGDAAIDVHEFLGEIDDQPQSEWHAVEKNRFMTEYDHNKDGLLTGDEIRKWLIPDVDAVAAQEAQHLLNGADKNNDGKLSIDEIVDAHALFVGSEATNYGEDLHKMKIFLIFVVFLIFHTPAKKFPKFNVTKLENLRKDILEMMKTIDLEIDIEELDTLLELYENRDELKQKARKLGEMEEIRRMTIVAGEMDQNNDGSITFDIKLAEEHLKKYDVDQNDMLNWEEHQASILEDTSLDSLDKLEQGQLKRQKTLFEAADLDSDKELDIEELPALLNPTHQRYMVGVLTEVMISEFDENGDGYVSFDELISSEDPSFRDFDKAMFDVMMDRNADGRLSYEEFYLWLDQDLEAEVEAQRLIEKCDSNGDGKLSYSEISSNHRRFEASAATEYGEYLLKYSHDEL